MNNFTILMGQTLYQATPLETNTSLQAHLRQNLVGNSCIGGVPQYLEEVEQQAEVSGDVPPPLQIAILTHFVSFSFLSISIISLLPFSL